MKVLLDTSTIVAAIVKQHVHHKATVRWLEAVHQQKLEAVVSGHSLTEVYATLSRMPTQPRMSSTMAGQLIRSNLIGHVSIVSLTGDHYIDLVDRLAASHLAGGVVYDAVHGAVAQAAGVDQLVTLNVGDFVRVVDTSMIPVVSPETHAPPS